MPWEHLRREYPLLEFDDNPVAMINPGDTREKMDVPRHCVITYFRDSIEALAEAGRLEKLTEFKTETVDIPAWKIVTDAGPLCLTQGYLGAAAAAGMLEELVALGCDTFVVCGGAGALAKMPVGQVLLVESAVRDEGVSYHYLPPAREVACDAGLLAKARQVLEARKVPCQPTKTWTTDAFYRETRDKVALRTAEGCTAVEMEAAAYLAVSQFRGVKLVQLLYSGDDLSSDAWDPRDWNLQGDVREKLVELSMELCLQL